MKKSKFSDVKVVQIVRESRAEGVAATARKHKISEQTLYLWRRKFGGMEGPERGRRNYLFETSSDSARERPRTYADRRPTTSPR